MRISILLAIVPLLVASCSAIPHSKRATTEDVTFYAYGTNISGIALTYGSADGLAYIGSGSSSNSSSYEAVTLDLPDTLDTSVAWNATLNSTGASVGQFYIVDNGFSSVGFLSSNSTVSNTTTTGFTLFGGQVVFQSATALEAQFWAQTTSEDGVWALMWNEPGTNQENSTPVVLKNKAPSTTTTF